MTEICFSYIILLPRFLAHSSPNPWNFLNVENGKGILFVNEVTFGKLTSVGAGYFGAIHVIRGLQLSVQLLDLWEEERG